MTYAQLLDHYKTQGAIAKALEVSQAAVSLWQRRGIPKLRQYQIAAVIAAEPKTIAPETPIAAPQSVAVPIKPSDTIPLRWWATEPGIMAAGKALGLEANRGESWASYTERLRDQLSKR